MIGIGVEDATNEIGVEIMLHLKHGVALMCRKRCYSMLRRRLRPKDRYHTSSLDTFEEPTSKSGWVYVTKVVFRTARSDRHVE